MSDILLNTPNEARDWCPGCEPDADPLREVLVERRCYAHAPSAGIENFESIAVMEAGGSSNRDFCNLLHRGVLTVALVLLTGCASGVLAQTPHTNDATEEIRAKCLDLGGIWMESKDRFQCRPPQQDPRA